MNFQWEDDIMQSNKAVFYNSETYLAQEFKNESSLLSKPLSTNSAVPGNIHNPEFFEYWVQVLKVDPNFQRFLKEGYALQFKDGIPPPPVLATNNKSFLEKKEFGIEEILRLEKLGCIYPVNEQPEIVLPLSVVYSNKWRLVVDASRHINPYIEQRHVKLETLDEAELSVKQGDFQAISDLDSGYWHIKMHQESQRYVGIHYVDKNGKIHFYQWKVLFLGLSDAVRLFTKVLKPLRAHLYRNGIRHNLYIDDIRVLGNSEDECSKINNFALHALRSAGWIVKSEKCSKPLQSVKFLGQISDLDKMLYFCPDDKKVKIFEMIDYIVSKKKVHVKQLASIYGKIVANRHSLGDIVRLMTRFGFRNIAEAYSWNCFVVVTEEVIFELNFFKENWDSLNGCPIRVDRTRVTVNGSKIEVASDASAIGEYIYEVSCGKFAFKRAFSADEAEESSTLRELRCFEDFYDHYGKKLRGKAVVHYTDAQNVANMLQIGSRTVDTHKRIVRLYLQLKQLNIFHVAVWLPRDDPRIKVADEGSRDFDIDNWMIAVQNFVELSECWGPFTIDVFASDENARVNRYYTKERSVFCQDLTGEHVWACPPPRLIIPAIKHFVQAQVTGVLCVPIWQASPFWVALCPNGSHLARFVKDYSIFKPYFVAGLDMTNQTCKGHASFKMIALDCDFSVKNPFEPNKDDYFKVTN